MTKQRRASNWVNRDEPLEEKLIRVLAFQFGRDRTDPVLLEWASVIRGMVEADASEVQLAAYLNTLPARQGPSRPPIHAYWHSPSGTSPSAGWSGTRPSGG